MGDFGSIVLVPFPFTDLTASKVRPALVISRTDRTARDVILCFITSRPVNADESGTLPLTPTKASGLKVPSVVRFDKIATLERRLVLGELGRIDARTLKRHRRRFLSVFGF